MSKIDELIKQMCPRGVEYKEFENICYVGKKDAITKTQLMNTGAYPVVNSARGILGYLDRYNNEGNTLVLTSHGAYAGYCHFMEDRFFAGALCYPIRSSDENKVLTKYIYYWLKNIEEVIRDVFTNKSGVPYINFRALMQSRIPVPPLEIQKEIVKVLDVFTEYDTELQAELQARIKQYEYYRDKLLSFDNLTTEGGQVEWKTLGEVGIFKRGNGIQKKDFVLDGFPCIHYGQLYTYYGIYASKTKTFIPESLAKNKTIAQKGDLVIATTSENDDDVCKAVAWVGDNDAAISGDAYVFHHKESPKYMSYFFRSTMFQEQKQRYITGTKVRRVSGDNMAKIKIPLPPLRTQERIVNILDAFDAVCNDLKSGLPAEIDARQKQYEYYRNKLLTFKTLEKEIY